MESYIYNVVYCCEKAINWYIKPFLQEELSSEDQIKHAAIAILGSTLAALFQKRSPMPLKMRISYNLMSSFFLLTVYKSLHRSLRLQLANLPEHPVPAPAQRGNGVASSTGEAPDEEEVNDEIGATGMTSHIL